MATAMSLFETRLLCAGPPLLATLFSCGYILLPPLGKKLQWSLETFELNLLLKFGGIWDCFHMCHLRAYKGLNKLFC